MKSQTIAFVAVLLTHLFVGTIGDTTPECPCQLPERPNYKDKAATARWMVHALDWGTLSTISTRMGVADIPFGNIYSFVDGTCGNATGTPYFYGSYMDQSLADTLDNPSVSLSLSEASLPSVCTNKESLKACTLGTQYGDPENPICARLTLTGQVVVVDESSAEFEFARAALFERHATMEDWPENHGWVIFKIDIEDIWLIDFFGGATILTPEEYNAASLFPTEEESL
eukprot:Nitzschia sp. Nitz4//scaffold8_size234185//53950//54633//NITZ4_001240-RA/size234185-processed-gene-0.146-mRNA-1//-1//CDS//3329559755//1675//frame0